VTNELITFHRLTNAQHLGRVRRETGSWRWPAFLFLYTGTLAWLVSFAVYQIGRSLGLD
jgi:Fe2+ transport system protein B